MKKKFLVTGGLGFIGSYLVDKIMQLEHEVTVFDNLSKGRIINISNWMGKPNFTLVEADMLDRQALNQYADVISSFI